MPDVELDALDRLTAQAFEGYVVRKDLAVERGATTLLIPISARKQLNDLSDDLEMKLSILYYADSREALLKALAD